MFNLLSIFSVIDDTASTTMIVISAIVAVLLALILVAFCFRKKSFDTKTLVFSALTIATSFVLSYLKVTPVTYGGSITLCSMLAICLYAYCFGFLPALFTGIIYGILQFFQSSAYIFNYATFFLDFILAFSSIVMMCVARKFIKNKGSFILGLTMTFAVRFIFHFLSGMLYFENGGIWANLPQDNAFIYSFLYQVVYVIPDGAIAIIALVLLAKSGALNQLLKAINPKKFKSEKSENTQAIQSTIAQSKE